ncbi:unnamed protein product [Pedinophyceae sp. YPF-701]|nr:unnamed protein product [Pedinophyceae sp. YPF-701]
MGAAPPGGVKWGTCRVRELHLGPAIRRRGSVHHTDDGAMMLRSRPRIVSLGAVLAALAALAVVAADVEQLLRPTCGDLLAHLDKALLPPTTKVFPGPVLGYVTPWNAKGYVMAEKYRAKLTHISPVWYQLRTREGARAGAQDPYAVTGGHDADLDWVSRLRSQPSGVDTWTPPLIVPRVILELDQAGWQAFFAPGDVGAASRAAAVRAIAGEVAERGYDGVVLEGWSALQGAGVFRNTELRSAFLSFVKGLSNELRGGREGAAAGERRHGVLVLAVPPAAPSAKGAPKFTRFDWRDVSAYVDLLSVMTYDHGPGGPNAPIDWVIKNIARLVPRGKGSERAALAALETPRVAADQYPPTLASGGQTRSCAADTAPGECQERPGAGLAAHLLVGLNFYGAEYDAAGRGGPILGNDFLERVREACEGEEAESPLSWSDEFMEHTVESERGAGRSGGGRRAWFPTRASLRARLAAATRVGAGVAVWELGQGLESFFDDL